jgi:hypothetical protein
MTGALWDVRFAACEGCKTEKVSTANIYDIMIDIELGLWFEGEEFVVS